LKVDLATLRIEAQNLRIEAQKDGKLRVTYQGWEDA
jgi:hypothetical protein